MLLNQGLDIGSSGPPENLEAVLNALPGGTYFMATTNGNEITHGKPNPEVFLKTAGCAVIGLTGTTSREHLARADLMVDSLRELSPKTFKELISSPSRSQE